MADIFEITGRIHSTSQEHVISPADEILDTSQNKKQHLINSDVARHESEINSPTNGLNKRVADIEALGQIGDTPVETNASNIINNTSLNGKVPSASAVNGIYNAVAANAGYYACDSEASTAAKVVEASGYVLTVGGCIKIKMTNANTADDATLNINSTGAKPLYYAGERASATNSWEEGETVEVYYNGTSYYANNVAGGSGSGDGAFDVSVKYPTSGVEGGNTYTLEGALAVLNTNLPTSKKKGGMSVKFVQSIDHKYVQWRCMAQNFTTDVTNWQGVDDAPTAESDNLVKSGGVFTPLNRLNIQVFGLEEIPLTDITNTSVNYSSKCFNNNLELVDSVSAYHAEKVDVSAYVGATIKFFAYSPDGGYYGFIKIDGTLSDVTTASSSNPTPYNQKKTLTIPSGAKFLCLSWVDSYAAQEITVERAAVESEIDREFDEIRDDIEDINEGLGSIPSVISSETTFLSGEKVKNINIDDSITGGSNGIPSTDAVAQAVMPITGYEAIALTDITNQATVTSSKMYDSNLELEDAVAAYSAYEINVAQYSAGTIKFYAYGPANSYYGFVMSDGTLRNVTAATEGSYNQKKTLVVPEGAKFLRLVWATTFGISQEITIEREEVLSEIEQQIKNLSDIVEKKTKIIGQNKSNPDKFVRGALNVTTGVVTTTSVDGFVTDFIDLSGAFGYVDACACQTEAPYLPISSWAKYCFYAADKSTVISGDGSDGVTPPYPLSRSRIAIPNGAAYVRFVFTVEKNIVVFDHEDDVKKAWVPYQETEIVVDEKWKNKKVLVLGDSISDDNYYWRENGGTRWEKWPGIIHLNQGIDFNVDALHASGFVVNMGTPETGPRAMVNRIENHYGEEYDLIILFMGTNDALQNITIGTQPAEDDVIDDTNKADSFYNAVEYVFRYIINNFTSSRFVLITPLQTSLSPNSHTKNYVDALKAECDRYNVQYLDLFEHGGFRPYNSAFKNMFTEYGGTSSSYAPDGLHPNKKWDNGYLAPQIADFINHVV